MLRASSFLSMVGHLIINLYFLFLHVFSVMIHMLAHAVHTDISYF